MSSRTRVLDDRHERVDLRDGRGGPENSALGAADVGLPVDDLALEVRLVDDVVVDDAERADSGGGEVEQRGAAESTGADDEHLGVLDRFCPVMPTSGMMRCRL